MHQEQHCIGVFFCGFSSKSETYRCHIGSLFKGGQWIQLFQQKSLTDISHDRTSSPHRIHRTGRSPNELSLLRGDFWFWTTKTTSQRWRRISQARTTTPCPEAQEGQRGVVHVDVVGLDRVNCYVSFVLQTCALVCFSWCCFCLFVWLFVCLYKHVYFLFGGVSDLVFPKKVGSAFPG